MAVLPLVAGLTGDAFYDPAKMTDGFHMAMLADRRPRPPLGGVLAWFTIESDVLAPERSPAANPRAARRATSPAPSTAPAVLPGHPTKDPAEVV